MEINFINPEPVRKAIEEMNCGNTPFAEVNPTDFWLPFIETKPVDGYELSVNPETGEKFPDCCENHKNRFKEIKEWFEQFPNCCPDHRKLLTTSWFKKENYSKTPLKVLQQVDYTLHQIIQQSNQPDWYKKTTDYIYYNIDSFGQLPTGYGNPVGLHLYLADVKFILGNEQWLKDKGISKDKSSKILQYIEEFYNPKEQPHRLSNKTDMNMLYATYQKWLKVFPFEISYFVHLKQQFKTQLPFLVGKPELNIYTGLAKAKMQTQKGLVEALTNTTKQLLQQINTADLLSKGIISDNNKHSIELVNETHRVKQASLLGEFSKTEMRYVTVLKKWLANEKDYFKEIIPLIKAEPPIQVETKTDKLKNELGKYGFFDLPLVKPLTDEKKDSLTELISSNKLPYKIAMIDFLGFIKHLEKEHFPQKYKLNKEIAKWFNSDKDGRGVKANISSLLKQTAENKERYTAHKHKETVQNDYQKLK